MSDELEDLRAWKESASQILATWDKVYEALGSPGELGEPKAEAALALVNGASTRTWTEWRLVNLAEGAYRLTVARGERLVYTYDDAVAHMAPYHRPGDGFEVREYRRTTRILTVENSAADVSPGTGQRSGTDVPPPENE